MFDVSKNKGPRACATCAKAKSRCVPSPVANVCERCHRLKKPCGSQTPAPPRRRRPADVGGLGGLGGLGGAGAGNNVSSSPGRAGAHAGFVHGQPGKQHKPGPKPTRVAELERRLEDLTSRLESVSWPQQQQQQQQQQQPQHQQHPQQHQHPQARQQPTPPKEPSTQAFTPFPDIFEHKIQMGYMYPARHVFYSDASSSQGTSSATRDAIVAAATGVAGPVSASALVSPPVVTDRLRFKRSTIFDSVADESGNNNADHTSNHVVTSSPSSSSTAPTAAAAAVSANGTAMDTDNVSSGCILMPSMVLPGQQQLFDTATAARIGTDEPDTTPSTTGLSSSPSASTSTSTSASVSAPTPTSLSTSAPGPSVADIWPQGEEAQDLLDEFRINFMSLLPFVIIPSNVHADELRATRPYLWKAVMMEAYHLNGPRQIQLGNQLLGEIAAAAFLQPRRSVDVLQAVLLLIAWFHYNINSFQLNNLLFLARGMCVSLNLCEPAPSISGTGAGTGDEPVSSDTLDKMRTYAGTFYLISLATTTGKRPDAMMNTGYLEKCCQVLERQMEYPSDAYLVQLVRIQQLAQSVVVTFALREQGMMMGLSIQNIVQNLQQQIDAYKAQIPKEYLQYGAIVGHVHIVEILLYGVVFHESHNNNNSSSSSNNDDNINNSNNINDSFSPADRLSLLWACLYSTKAYVRNRFFEPVANHPRYLCLTSFDFMYAFLAALKLMTYQMPGWDCRRVRRELAFDELIDHQIYELQMVVKRRMVNVRKHSSGSGSGGGGGGGEHGQNAQNPVDPLRDPFDRLAERLRSIKVMIGRELDKLPPGESELPAMMHGATTATTSTTTATSDTTAAAAASYPFTAGPGAFVPVTATLDEDTNLVDAQPILSLADGTMDCMTDAAAAWADTNDTSGWESYLDVNMNTTLFAETWGTM
ncbi:thiamine biosynthetic bifunctional enzyme [Niveomyces insectorum RCEF 264]|uniref:Thiamine biosynthetic bifunctional enzyme n=1 Tax=Niveomyces insectorum RCEF 264 TaxID=1081102 RepID=A0A167QQ81_9HYPO|nr:thiamine biosynthetic bifunctional enzyme [Niveomyces insectorum RCEF 264]